MKVISILNPKGGSGKTTISTNLARALQKRGHSVLLVDSDPQGSARDWHACLDENPVPLVALDRPTLMKSLSSIGAEHDFVLIDGAAKLEDMIAAAIKVSSFILIPVQPSPYDLWAVSDLVDFIKARQEVTDGTPGAGFIISRAISGTKLGEEINVALDDYGLGVFQAVVTQRQIYPRTASEGQTAFEGDNPDAVAEINTLTDELLSHVDGSET
ncbi:MAG: ParA family partition ATPase [Geminicoccaceae bacterium]